MTRVHFVRRSKALVRAVPVAEGVEPPHPKRAATAGFTGAAGQVADLVGRHSRLLLLGTGHAGNQEAAGALAVAQLPLEEHVALDARTLDPAAACALAVGACLRAWQFDRLRTRPNPERKRLRHLDLMVLDPAAAVAAWTPVHAMLQGALFARDLVAEPSNVITPQGFAARLARLEREGVHIEVLDHRQLRAEGLGALLAVGGASAHPPCMAVLRWRGTAGGDPVALVGKGITFDTGGVSVKPGAGMWEMRTDMAGAAACAGAMLALALRRCPVPAVAVLPLAENALGAASYRPGDVLRTYGGVTVEVVDTDAEGRLVLADALAWSVANLHPRAIVDLATLTGAVIVALGQQHAGLFGNNDGLATAVLEAGREAHEPAWRLPITDGHREILKSDIADLRQCGVGSSQPDACHAAAFLDSFVGDTPWVHLDIAGMEWRERGCDRHAPGATGFGVRLLDRLMRRFE